ncbi:extracellular solute-binding protein [Nonomuraea sp. NPDC050663]|uniref:extracellular solute-binding protein n=1 Tax=Nonomuraea sp. NPDC050663 TaxID=3364370 RepID=UPI0037B6CF91
MSRTRMTIAALLVGLLAGWVWFYQPLPFQREPLAGAASGSPAQVSAAPVPAPNAGACTPRAGLTVATGDDISRGSHRRDVIADWSAERKISATMLEVSGSTDVRRAQLAAAAQAGSCEYDILVLDVAHVAEFAEFGYIKPIDLADDSRFLPGPLEAGRYDGRQYGVPFAADAPLEYARKEVDTTGWALQLDDAEAGTINMLELADVLDGDRVALDSAGWRALRDYQRSAGREPVLAESLSYDEDSSLKAFRDGRTHLGNQVTHMRNWPIAFHRLAADPLMRRQDGTLAFRIRAPRRGVLGGSVLAVSAHIGPERERQALQLIEDLTRHDVQLRLFACGGYAPVLASVYTAYAGGHGPDCAALLQQPRPTAASEVVEIGPAELKDLAAQIKTSIDRSVMRPRTAYYSQFSKAFRSCATGVINRRVSEQVFLDASDSLTQALSGRTVKDPPC